MCNIENPIISLILQEMRLDQYLSALRKLGIEVYELELDIVSIVAMLMGVDDFSDEWVELYTQYINRSVEVPIEPMGQNLWLMAEECYWALKEFRLNL